MALKGKKTLFEIGQRTEIVGREDFSLDNREIDFDLVEPTGVDRGVDEDRIRPLVAQTLDGFLTSMSGTVVHNPKDMASGFIRLLAHDLADEPVYRSDAALDFATTEDLGAMDIPGRQIGPGTSAEVLVLDACRAVGRRRQRRLFTAARLNTRLFVCGNDIVIAAQGSALPNAFVKIEDGTGFIGKVRIARKDPASMLPRAKGIAAEPAPQRGTADLGDQTLRNHVLTDLLDRETGQRTSEAVRKLAGQCLNLNDETGGKSGLYARLEAAPQGQAVGQERIAYATC